MYHYLNIAVIMGMLFVFIECAATSNKDSKTEESKTELIPKKIEVSSNEQSEERKTSEFEWLNSMLLSQFSNPCKAKRISIVHEAKGEDGIPFVVYKTNSSVDDVASKCSKYIEKLCFSDDVTLLEQLWLVLEKRNQRQIVYLSEHCRGGLMEEDPEITFSGNQVEWYVSPYTGNGNPATSIKAIATLQPFRRLIEINTALDKFTLATSESIVSFYPFKRTVTTKVPESGSKSEDILEFSYQTIPLIPLREIVEFDQWESLHLGDCAAHADNQEKKEYILDNNGFLLEGTPEKKDRYTGFKVVALDNGDLWIEIVDDKIWWKNGKGDVLEILTSNFDCDSLDSNHRISKSKISHFNVTSIWLGDILSGSKKNVPKFYVQRTPGGQRIALMVDNAMLKLNIGKEVGQCISVIYKDVDAEGESPVVISTSSFNGSPRSLGRIGKIHRKIGKCELRDGQLNFKAATMKTPPDRPAL